MQRYDIIIFNFAFIIIMNTFMLNNDNLVKLLLCLLHLWYFLSMCSNQGSALLRIKASVYSRMPKEYVVYTHGIHKSAQSTFFWEVNRCTTKFNCLSSKIIFTFTLYPFQSLLFKLHFQRIAFITLNSSKKKSN
jgi:hypothetical protein